MSTGTDTPDSTRARATKRDGAATASNPSFSAATVAAGTSDSSQKNRAASRAPRCSGRCTG